MARTRKVPMRTCVTCGQMRPKRELVRVVRTPAGDVKTDATGKLSGRGAYVCPTPACAGVALREHRLEHALEVPMPEALGDELERAIAAATAAAAGQDRPRVIGPIPLAQLSRRSGR